MLILLSCVIAGFVLWRCIDRRFPASTELHALIVLLACLALGLVIGLWADGDTIHAITSAIRRGPSPGY